ncbi:MAG: DUF4249 domain-containing protein [Runella sp.]
MKKELLLLLSLGLAACETLVNDVDPSRLPSSGGQLVVHGYLSPQDTVIQVSVSLSQKVLGQSPSNAFGSPSAISIPGATVTLTHENKSVNLAFKLNERFYTTAAQNIPIVAGQTYHLKVSYQGQTVTSSCTIPQAVPITEVRQDSVAAQGFMIGGTNPNLPKDRTYKIFWQDPAGQANFYRVEGYLVGKQRVRQSNGQIKIQEFINFINFDWQRRRSNNLYSDDRLDGKTLSSSEGRLNYFLLTSNRNDYVAGTGQVNLLLISCDKAYYNYHRLLENYDDDNPFAEPTLLPSNIQGGLGCFAGYNQSRVLLPLR